MKFWPPFIRTACSCPLRPSRCSQPWPPCTTSVKRIDSPPNSIRPPPETWSSKDMATRCSFRRRLEDHGPAVGPPVAPWGAGDLVLDDSYFVHPIIIPGRSRSTEPYDAPSGALCVNFNTVFFKRLQRALDQRPVRRRCCRPSSSAASRLPALPRRPHHLFRRPQRNPGLCRRAHASFHDPGGDYHDRTASRFGPGSIPEGFFAVALSNAEAAADRFCLIAEMLSYSNNFIANQLMLAMGASVFHDRPPRCDQRRSRFVASRT